MSERDAERPDLDRIEGAVVAALAASQGRPTSVILRDFLAVLLYAKRLEEETGRR